MAKPYRKDYIPIPEQIEAISRWKAIDALAKKAGFTTDALAHTEFSLLVLFELIAEECAKVAEAQARVYTGENNESAGCHGAANAIRTFAKTFGNK